MWLYDFLIFYNSGKAIISGVSPYVIDGFISPIFLALFFAPFSLLPVGASYILFLLSNLLLAWKFLKKRLVWAILFFPFLFALFVGQIDFLITGIILIGSPWTIALALVKPQLAFVVVPWMILSFKKSDWIKAGFSTSFFVLLSFIIQPTWFKDWLYLQSNFASYSTHASNIYWLIPNSNLTLKANSIILFSFLIIPIGLILINRRDSWTILHLFAPLTNIYSPSVLLEWVGPVEVILSWATVFLVRGNIHTGMPFFLIGISVFVRSLFYQKNLSKDQKLQVKNMIHPIVLRMIKKCFLFKNG